MNQVRYITLRYEDSIKGFSEDAILSATFGRTVVDRKEYFFVQDGVPHLLVSLLLSGQGTGDAVPPRRNRGGAYNNTANNGRSSNRNNNGYSNNNDNMGFRLSSIRSENCETKRANPIPRGLRSATDAETKMHGRGGRVGGATRLKSAGRLKTI